MITTALNASPGNPSSPRQSKAPSSRPTPRGRSRANRSSCTRNQSIARRRTTWQRQLLAVDFRHAFWPWTVYIASIFAYYYYLVPPLESEHHSLPLWLITTLIALSAAGVTVRVFCIDFADGTTERLLCNPVPRFDIWNLRLLLSLALVFVPALLTYIVVPHMASRSYLTIDMFNLLQERSLLIVFIAWCIWSTGPLWSLVLRRPILAYAPIVLAPVTVLVVAALINQFNPPDYGIIAIILGLAAQFFAAHLWRRLEVNQ